MKALKAIGIGSLIGIGIAMFMGIFVGYIALAAKIPEWLHLPSWVSALMIILSITVPAGIVIYLKNFSD